MSDIERLYDRYSARLYALALRILGDNREAAASTLEDVFVALASGQAGDSANADPLPWLVRAIRDRALARQAQNAVSSVIENGDIDVTPRILVEEAFYQGMDVRELARRHSLTEEQVRERIRHGMAELRAHVGAGGRT